MLRKPLIYQPLGSRSGSANSHSVDGGFALLTDNRIGFQVGPYDHSQPLIIDPVLVYSSFLGGTDNDFDAAIAVDRAGNAYVSGATASIDFPTTSRAFQRSFGGVAHCDDLPSPCSDATVTKINRTGTAIVYSTYLGGSDAEEAMAIAIDASGDAYITGYTRSLDFPVTPGAFQPAYHGYTKPCNEWLYCGDAFVTKIAPSGTALVYSTYLSGREGEYGAGIAVDTARNAYVAGPTDSPDFPITPGAFQENFSINDCGLGLAGLPRNCMDGFVAKLNPVGSALVYSTFLSGNADDIPYALTVDAAGHAFVAGASDSRTFPTTPNAYQPQLHPGLCPWGEVCYDAFLTKLDKDGAAAMYSSFLGGFAFDEAHGLALDAAGNAYLAGRTTSADFPVTPGAFQTTFGGGICNNGFDPYCHDVFVAKFDLAKSGPASLVYSTYLGGDGEDSPWDPIPIAVDRWGNAHVGGFTYSANFPAVSPLQGVNLSAPDGPDGFLTKLNPSGTAAVFSTFLGGDGWDQIEGVALDAAGNVYVAGFTNSWWGDTNPFPITSHAFQRNFRGGQDIIVGKISPANAPSAVLYPKELQFGDIYVNTWSPPQTVMLRNVGSGTLRIAEIKVTSGDKFYQSNDCSQQVAGAGSCTVTVYFTPGEVGQAKGHLKILDNAEDSPQFVPLYGRGVH